MAKTVAAVREAPQADAGSEKPRRSRRRVILLVGVAVVVVAVAVAAWLLRGGEEEEEEEPVAEGPIVDVAQLTVNLAGPDLHYARVGFAAVLAEGVDVPEVEQRFALLQDGALTEIGRFESSALRTPEGVAELRDRLTSTARDLYPDGEVLRIVLTELLVQ